MQTTNTSESNVALQQSYTDWVQGTMTQSHRAADTDNTAKTLKNVKFAPTAGAGGPGLNNFSLKRSEVTHSRAYELRSRTLKKDPVGKVNLPENPYGTERVVETTLSRAHLASTSQETQTLPNRKKEATATLESNNTIYQIIESNNNHDDEVFVNVEKYRKSRAPSLSMIFQAQKVSLLMSMTLLVVAIVVLFYLTLIVFVSRKTDSFSELRAKRKVEGADVVSLLQKYINSSLRNKTLLSSQLNELIRNKERLDEYFTRPVEIGQNLSLSSAQQKFEELSYFRCYMNVVRRRSDVNVTRIRKYRNGFYYFSETKYNWSTSQTFCHNLNATLVTILDKNENSFVYNESAAFFGNEPAWIGLSRNFTRCRDTATANDVSIWRWDGAGQDLNYTNWRTEEPNNECSNKALPENCVHLIGNRYALLWNDIACDMISFFVCKWC